MSTTTAFNDPDRVNHVHTPSPDIKAVLEKYNYERDKRLRTEGSNQYTAFDSSEKLQHLANDPWAGKHTPKSANSTIENGGRYEFVIVGAGYTGLQIAVRLIEAGVSEKDIRFVDSAGGFGGTWYWNRYPGLMCDVESYIYMPLLEELSYMPKHKYSYGSELRTHAENIAAKYKLTDKALFRFKVNSLAWDENTKDWNIKAQSTNPSRPAESRAFRAHFVLLSPGLLNWPKLPQISGLDVFKGYVFHTSRWDYDYTGGGEDGQKLDKLQGKSVAILGTGATAIQVVPELVKSAKKVYVIQRTPSAVDRRDQRATDPTWWAKQTSSRGWQNARRTNFNSFITNNPAEVDLVHDGWTGMPSYAALAGTPKEIPLTQVPEHIALLHKLDLSRSQRIRTRVKELVKAKDTAEKLQAWYPGWCKRPCFHDEYLQSFNEEHVTLIDTDGHGLEGLTTDGFLHGGHEYPIDLLILSTGYEPPVGISPAGFAHAEIRGRDGQSLEDAWKDGPKTLHGIVTHGFPNLFFFSLTQSGLSSNFTHSSDAMATHTAGLIAQAVAKVGRRDAKMNESYRYPFTIEVSAKAEDLWTSRVVQLSTAGAAMTGCTPGYFNKEGEVDQMAQLGPKAQLKLARAATWGKGLEEYIMELLKWRKQGDLEGIELTLL
ncbi:flavin-binding monooxygenase-like family protein [Pyrenochaeta sp. DS3sAY3a]|nr:flavin-binding monooxygenase-like family protein [Pyrenochaeta sp. DS3sAY3a]